MVIYKTKMSIVHIQCLLRIYGMVAFWLVSCLHPPFVLCLSLQVPPMQQVAAYCTCRAWYSNFSCAANTIALIQRHGFFQRLAYYRRQPQTLAVVQLHSPYTVVSKQFRLQLATHLSNWLNGVLLYDFCGDSLRRVFQ